MKYFNAHCHLELSYLRGRIPPGLPFAEWLEWLVTLRKETPREEREQAVREAIRLARETGTAAMCDMLAREDDADLLLRQASGLRVLMFREILNFDEQEGPEDVNRALARQNQHGPLPDGKRHGLAPHAPYTTSAALLRAAATAAQVRNQWLCIHAAETAEETQLMLTGRGPIRELIDPFLTEEWRPPRMRPLPWLDACGCLGPQTLLVHCNDIDERDLRLIRGRGCSVVVCPGSHVYFDRGEFPLARLLDAGIPVYLGTDSLASNDSLDMTREVDIACELVPGVPRDRIAALAAASRAGDFGL